MKCLICEAEITYLDRRFKKCRRGHITKTFPGQYEEWKKGVEKQK